MSESLKAMKKASESKTTSKKVVKSIELKKKASLSQIANKVMDKQEEPTMASESSLFPVAPVEKVGTNVNKQIDKSLQPGSVFVEPPKATQSLSSYGYGYNAGPQPVKIEEKKEKSRTSYSTFGSIGSGFSGV